MQVSATSAKIYTPEQIHSMSYSPSLKSRFIVKDFVLENRTYSEIQFQLIDDLEESFPNTFFLAVINTVQENHEIKVERDDMKKGQTLKQSETYLLIKVPPGQGIRQKTEAGQAILSQPNDIKLFLIKDNHRIQNPLLYTLKCMKIKQLRKKSESKHHLMEDKIYENIYQLMKNIEYPHHSIKVANIMRSHNLVWGQENCYYIQNREELNQVKSQGQPIDKSALNNILGIMKLLIIWSQNQVDKDQSLEIPIQDIRKCEQKTFKFTGKYREDFSFIWKNCIKYIKILYQPNNRFQVASDFMSNPQTEHLYSLAQIQQKTLIFTEYKANTTHFLKYDPLESWTEREILRYYQDLNPKKEKQYCKLLPKQKNEQVPQSDQPIDSFLVNQKMQIKSYKFSKESKKDIGNYIKNTERIIWTKILQNKQKQFHLQRISQIIRSYQRFEKLRELALIQCNISSLPNLYSTNRNYQQQVGLFGLKSLRGLFLDRNKIKNLSAQDKGDVYGVLELLSVNRNPIQRIDLDYLKSLRLLRLKSTSLPSLQGKNKSVLKPMIECVLPLPQQQVEFIGYQYFIPRILPQCWQVFTKQAAKIYDTAIKLISSGWRLFYRVDAFGGEAKEQKQYYKFVSSPNWRYDLNKLQEIFENQKKKRKQLNDQLEREEFSEYDQYYHPEVRQEVRPVRPTKRYQYLSYHGHQGHYAQVGGRIFFPHQIAYKCQINMMEYIYKNLENNNSMLIQSQTGTGKTLSILASVLGWVQNDNQKKRQKLKQREKLDYIKWGEVDRTSSQPINKIIYMSRSHTQLEQVSQQLAKTCYRPDVVVVGSRLKLCAHQTVSQIPELEKLNKKCQHAIEATKQLEKLNKMTIQQKLKSQLWSDEIKLKQKFEELQKQMCKYYKEFEIRRDINNKVFQDLSGKAIKIEDQKITAESHQTCPYFYPSGGKFFTNLILMPYIYLLNQNLLKNNVKYIPNSIIIFDEGHNILSEAEEGASLTIKENFFTYVIKDLEKISKDNPKKTLRVDQEKISFDPQQQERLKIQEVFQQEKLIGSTKKQPPQKQEPEIRRIPKQQREQDPLKFLKQLDKNFAKYREIKIKQMEKKFYQQKNKKSIVPNQQQEGQEYEPEAFDQQQQEQIKNAKSERIEFIRSEQIKSEILFAFLGPLRLRSKKEIDIEINELFRKLKGVQLYLLKIQKQKNDKNGKQGKTKIYITSWTKFFDKVMHMFQILDSQTLDPDYGLYLHSIWRDKQDKQDKQQKLKNTEVKKNQQQSKQLSQKRSLYMKLRCFNSSIMFQKIKNLKPKSVMIASGTLFPPQEWFPYTSLYLRSRAFPFSQFNKEQIMTVNVSKNQGESIRLTTENFEYKLKLALHTIQIICKSTPQGVLVIFPSKRWVIQAKKIIGVSRVGGKTVRFQNKKQTANLELFVNNYQKQCLSQNGAVLFAFCRGSLSEGINFKDQLCRAVVMIGVPLQPYKDPYIVGKKQYCDKKYEIDKKKGTKICPVIYRHQKASEWSKHQVAKTISQGIGRVIRTISDYGVIYLVDERYNKNVGSKYFNLDHISKWATQDQVFKNDRDTNQIEQLSKQFFDKQQKRLKKQEKEKAEKLKQQLESSII